ncbi:unnamed protein product [Vicia faba]|uniref:Uncharacterized protein n=1 Tax=Vicia faba TaxID=3906 RepID=A0AAV1AGV6_VICFA|nr:unnamed protein product [Vicia faba]
MAKKVTWSAQSTNKITIKFIIDPHYFYFIKKNLRSVAIGISRESRRLFSSSLCANDVETPSVFSDRSAVHSVFDLLISSAQLLWRRRLQVQSPPWFRALRSPPSTARHHHDSPSPTILFLRRHHFFSVRHRLLSNSSSDSLRFRFQFVCFNRDLFPIAFAHFRSRQCRRASQGKLFYLCQVKDKRMALKNWSIV